MELLTEQEIKKELTDLPLWQLKEQSIEREVSTANFFSAIGYVNAVAIIAETLDHHPDILIYGWNKIRITVSTHDKGGLTKKDFLLAKKIDEIVF